MAHNVTVSRISYFQDILLTMLPNVSFSFNFSMIPWCSATHKQTRLTSVCVVHSGGDDRSCLSRCGHLVQDLRGRCNLCSMRSHGASIHHSPAESAHLAHSSRHVADLTCTKPCIHCASAQDQSRRICRTLVVSHKTLLRGLAQWGSLDFHKKSLSNLTEAMRRTRKLCAIVIDTIGRELTVNRPTTDEEDGWPKFEKGITVKANDKVQWSVYASAIYVAMPLLRHVLCDVQSGCTWYWRSAPADG